MNPSSNVEFQLETSYQPSVELSEKEKEELLAKFSQTNSVEDLAEALKHLKAENDKTPESIKLSSNKIEVKALQITPSPAFAYKTKRIHDQKKVFINVTTHDFLEKPGVKKKLDKDGNEIEGINLPISVGFPREEVDKKGVSCLVYDIVVNPDVIQESDADPTGRYRDFICQLGIQSIEQKFKEQLDKKYKLPRLKYFGENVPPQTVQDRKNMPKIEEVSNKSQKSTVKAAPKEAPLPVVEKELSGEGFWIVAQTDHQFHQGSTLDSEFIYDLLIKCQASLPKLSIEVTNGAFRKIPYESSLTDYVDPIVDPPVALQQPSTGFQTIGFVSETKFESYLTLAALQQQLQLSMSPFKLLVKLPNYKKWTIYFPTAMIPMYSYYFFEEIEGSISQKKLIVFTMLDFADVMNTVDPGSKNWLVSQALHSEEGNGTSNPYQVFRSEPTNQNENVGNNDGSLPEDRFHIPLPKNVDPYTGVPMPENANHLTGEQLDEIELPEDRFHQKDAGSSFIIQQREQAKKDKWDKYEKEKAERKNDPNVEYIDMNDFKPGGKHSEKNNANPANPSRLSQTEELLQAKSVLESASLENVKSTISSNIWMDLLD